MGDPGRGVGNLGTVVGDLPGGSERPWRGVAYSRGRVGDASGGIGDPGGGVCDA